MRGVMAVSRRPQVEPVTECLKCADSRPGGISLGLEERGFFMHLTASLLYFLRWTVVLIPNNQS